MQNLQDKILQIYLANLNPRERENKKTETILPKLLIRFLHFGNCCLCIYSYFLASQDYFWVSLCQSANKTMTTSTLSLLHSQTLASL